MAAYFLLLLIMALPHGMHTALVPNSPPCTPQHACSLLPLATNDQITSYFGSADAAFIAKRAHEIVAQHDWGHISTWPFWPPGMVAIETFLYWISSDMPVALILILLSCALWSWLAAELSCTAASYGASRLLALLLPLALFFNQGFFYFLRTGLFYSESLSIAGFLMAIGALCKAHRQEKTALAWQAGAWFAFSAYMRAQTDMVMNIVLLLWCTAVIFKTLWRDRSLYLRSIKNTLVATPWLKVTAIALLAFQLLTLPYRAAHDMHWIAYTDNPMWWANWQREAELTPDLNFYRISGALAGCNVDPVLCDQIHTNISHGVTYTNHEYYLLAMQTLMHHPLKWMEYKWPYMRDFWFDGSVEMVVITGLLVFLLWCYAKKPRPIPTIMLLSTVIAVWGPLVIIHIETRYLYQLTLTILYIAIISAVQPPEQSS